MELTRKQQQTLDSRKADLAAYAAYANVENTKTDAMLADRNARYCTLRLSGLSVDAAYEVLRTELGLVEIRGLAAYDDEYQCGETLEQVIEWHAPQLQS